MYAGCRARASVKIEQGLVGKNGPTKGLGFFPRGLECQGVRALKVSAGGRVPG